MSSARRTGHLTFKTHARIVRAAPEPGRMPAVPEKALPSVGRMAVNFGRALAEEAAARLMGVPAVTSEREAERKAICEGCPEYRPSDGRCAKCGCWRNKKASWRSQRCPLKRW